MDQNQQPGSAPQNQPPPPPYPPQQYGPPPGGGMPPGYLPPPPPKRKSENKILGWVIGIVAACIILPVLGVVATIALPLMLSARTGAVNEKARNSLRTLVSAEEAYYQKEQHYAELDELVQAGYLDDRFSTGDFGNDIRVHLMLSEDGTSYDATVYAPTETYIADESGDITTW